MTDEEKTEAYINSLNTIIYDIEDNAINIAKYLREAYLDGLAEGKQKWHKVADGDYPPCEKGNYTINVLTDRGDIAYYNYDLECWVAEPSSAEIDPPIAWCEIPKYKE